MNVRSMIEVNGCLECRRLRKESSSAFFDLVLRRQALATTCKANEAFAVNRRALEKALERLHECQKGWHYHRCREHHTESTEPRTLRLLVWPELLADIS